MNNIPSSQFSTCQYKSHERYDVFRETMNTVFDVSELQQERDLFNAKINSYLIGDIMLVHCHTLGQTFTRSKHKIAQDGMDHYLIQLFYDGGTYRVNSSDKGDRNNLIVIDTSQEWSAINPDFDVLTLVLPRRVITSQLLSENAHHGRTLNMNNPMTRILGDFLLSLAGNIDMLDINEANRLLDPILTITATTLNSETKNAKNAEVNIQNLQYKSTLILIKDFIEKNISNPELNVDFICRCLNVSRAHIYKVFDDEDGVASYIRKRRLSLAYKKIVFSTNNVSQIAYQLGFSSENVFTRAFKKHFNKTPKQVMSEKNLHSFPTTNTDNHGHQWEKWLREL